MYTADNKLRLLILLIMWSLSTFILHVKNNTNVIWSQSYLPILVDVIFPTIYINSKGILLSVAPLQVGFEDLFYHNYPKVEKMT